MPGSAVPALPDAGNPSAMMGILQAVRRRYKPPCPPAHRSAMHPLYEEIRHNKSEHVRLPNRYRCFPSLLPAQKLPLKNGVL